MEGAASTSRGGKQTAKGRADVTKGKSGEKSKQTVIEDTFNKNVRFDKIEKVMECKGCERLREEVCRLQECVSKEREAFCALKVNIGEKFEVELKKLRLEKIGCEKVKLEVKAIEEEMSEKWGVFKGEWDVFRRKAEERLEAIEKRLGEEKLMYEEGGREGSEGGIERVDEGIKWNGKRG